MQSQHSMRRSKGSMGLHNSSHMQPQLHSNMQPQLQLLSPHPCSRSTRPQV